jgi:hypothetical protein
MGTVYLYIRLWENYLCTFDFCIIKAPDDGRTIGGRNMYCFKAKREWTESCVKTVELIQNSSSRKTFNGKEFVYARCHSPVTLPQMFAAKQPWICKQMHNYRVAIYTRPTIFSSQVNNCQTVGRSTMTGLTDFVTPRPHPKPHKRIRKQKCLKNTKAGKQLDMRSCRSWTQADSVWHVPVRVLMLADCRRSSSSSSSSTDLDVLRFKIEPSQGSSRVRWLNCKYTNVSTTISVPVKEAYVGEAVFIWFLFFLRTTRIS